MTEELTPAERVALAALAWREHGYKESTVYLLKEAIERAYPLEHERPVWECSNCAPLLAGASVDRVDGSDPEKPCWECGRLGEDLPTWNVGTWAWVLPGDRVRLGGVEATVSRRYAGEWFSKIDSIRLDNGKMWDKISPWKHREVKVSLQVDGQPEKSYKLGPNGEVEILCDAERTAILLLQAELNGEVIS